MCLLSILCTAGLKHPPFQFCLARASLAVCGLGTAVYHMLDQSVMDETRINGILLDGFTMAMVTVNLFLLHLSDWMKEHLMAVSVLCMLYLLFWAGTNDMLMYTYLSEKLTVNGVSIVSVGVQYPLFVIVYVYILLRVIYFNGFCEIWPMWLALGVALVAWGGDQFGCSSSNWFFIGHAVWHMCIGYVAVYLMVMGLLNGGGFQRVDDQSRWWIELTECTHSRLHTMFNLKKEDFNYRLISLKS